VIGIDGRGSANLEAMIAIAVILAVPAVLEEKLFRQIITGRCHKTPYLFLQFPRPQGCSDFRINGPNH